MVDLSEMLHASDSDEEEEDDAKLNQLHAMLSSLDKKQDVATRSTKRYPTEKNEAYKESEFHITTRDNHSTTVKKLDMGDLLSGVDATDLLSQLAVLDAGGKKGKFKQPVAAPVPKRVQERYDRKAAYEQAKKELSKWDETVKNNRQAEHLHFPMHRPDTLVSTSEALAADFKPSTSLEHSMSQLLHQHGVSEGDLQQQEDLQLLQLPLEQVQARQEELRMMRELMFRKELKLKRIAKIKSKTYRRIRKKDKLRLHEQIEQQLAEEDPDMAQELKQKALEDRALERMTLKHKNTGKWARDMLKHGKHDEARGALNEQLRRHESLKKKIQGDESSEEDPDDDLDDTNRDKEEVLQLALSKLDAMQDDKEATTSGIMNMKFMVEARQRKQAETVQMLQDAKAELTKMYDSDVGSSEEESQGDAHRVQGNVGRLVFAGDVKNTVAQKEEKEETIVAKPSKSVTIRVASGVTLHTVKETSNPWLATDTKGIKQQHKANTTTTKADKSAARLAKNKQHQLPKDEVELNLDVSKVMARKHHSDDEDDEEMVHASVAFKQRELVELAFANDNVVMEFEQEKQGIAEQDAPQEIDVTLPGWGAWDGQGIRPSTKRKREIIKKDGIEQSKRKDAKLQHVIISEKKNNKMNKYLVDRIPYPFKTREQYEKSLQTPLGKDWNTQTAFQKLTMPRVTTKMGSVIAPLLPP